MEDKRNGLLALMEDLNKELEVKGEKEKAL